MENLGKMKVDPSFYKGKRVFVTGHTGFKGSWLCYILSSFGANITGYSLEPATNPNLYELVGLRNKIESIIGDIRDYKSLERAFVNSAPEIVFHLAAQPLVRDGYRNPVYTFETNMMGTVNILECIRINKGVKSFINITTDKVYKNNEWPWGYRENDLLDGFDPYSNSKSCSELITYCYQRSFFDDYCVPISTARAGNVIGGGDFAQDRIIPDCIRAVLKGEKIIIRNPTSIRPYQHVLEPLFAYLMIAQNQYENNKYSGSYNIGPNDENCISTGELVKLFCSIWGENIEWENMNSKGPHEAHFLKLDCSKLKSIFEWSPRWNIREAVQKTCEWTRKWIDNGNIYEIMDRQIYEYLEGWN